MGDSKEELGELAGIKEKLERIVYENNCDICAIDDDADGVYFIRVTTGQGVMTRSFVVDNR